MIGRRGEKRFSLLCSDHDVTCNGSEEDDYGWDMFIEFPSRARSSIALDMQPNAPRALVQVKATKGDQRTVSLKLDNAIRYARSELPTFIVLAVIEGNRVTWYAKHVWAQLIGAWLLAGRIADADGAVAHTRQVSLTFNDDDCHDGDLLDWMAREIATESFDYVRRKAEIVRTIGFGERAGLVTASVVSEHAFDMIDLMLGLKDSVRVTRFTYTSERFGIRAREPEIAEGDGWLSVKPDGQDGTLYLDFAGTRRCSVAARLYGANDGTHSAWRLDAGGLDIVVGPRDRTQVRAHLGQETLTTPDQLLLFALLQQMPPESQIDLEMRIDDRTLDLGSISMSIRQAKGWPLLAMAVDAIRTVTTFSGQIAPDCSMGDLLRASDELAALSGLIGDVPLRLSCVPDHASYETFTSFLSFCSARVRDRSFGAVARRAIVSIDVKDGRQEFDFAPPTVLWTSMDADAAQHRDRIAAAYQKELARMTAAGDVLALGDLRLIADGSGEDRPLMLDRPDVA